MECNGYVQKQGCRMHRTQITSQTSPCSVQESPRHCRTKVDPEKYLTEHDCCV